MTNKTVASIENVNITTWLKAKRKESGHTMRTLAALLNRPHSFIGKVENQERRLDVVEYLRYCEALKIDPKEGLELAKS
jgi:transcriptional regulator with XRE-family HTH domain